MEKANYGSFALMGRISCDVLRQVKAFPMYLKSYGGTPMKLEKHT